MHRIIIVGGGAGGLELATRLGDKFGAKSRRKGAQITLVDRNPTHVWKPLLHEVAAGSMDPHAHQLEYIAQAYWHGFRFEQGSLSAVDRTKRTVSVNASVDAEGFEVLPARTLTYDTLVIAVGSNTNFFGVKGAETYALPLDTVTQAEKFRRRLISAVMRADATSHNTGQPGQVNIAIVGGGATGVELAAELRAASDIFAAYGLYRLDPHNDIRITLIESGSRILPALSERVSNAAAKILRERSINVMVSERVSEVTPTELQTANGKHIPADIAVWAAGIKAPAVLSRLDGLAVNANGQLIVRSTLQTSRDDNIFAFGDCAACALPESERNVPPRAQAAHQQASFLLKAMTRLLEDKPLPHFQYHDFGSLVSLGHESAVGSLMGGLATGALFIGGIAARVMYTSLYRMHLAALHGWPRTLMNTLSHKFRSATAPHIKLH